MDQSKLNEKDQAEGLRMQFSSEENSFNDEEKQIEIDKNQSKKIDILNLPKRQEVHRNTPTRTVLKLNKTLMRFILVTIIILVMLVAGVILN